MSFSSSMFLVVTHEGLLDRMDSNYVIAADSYIYTITPNNIFHFNLKTWTSTTNYLYSKSSAVFPIFIVAFGCDVFVLLFLHMAFGASLFSAFPLLKRLRSHLLSADSQVEDQAIHSDSDIHTLWSRCVIQHAGSRPKYLSSLSPSVSKTQPFSWITAVTSGYKLVWGLRWMYSPYF